MKRNLYNFTCCASPRKRCPATSRGPTPSLPSLFPSLPPDLRTGTPLAAPFMRNKLTMAMLSVVAVLQAAWVTWTLIPLSPLIVVFVPVVLVVRWSAVRSTRNDPRTIACSPLTLCTAPLRQASFVLPFAPIHATELALAPLVKWWEVRKGGSRTSGSGHTCMECWPCSTPDERTIVCSRLVLRAPAI